MRFELRNVTMQYGESTILRDVTFKMPVGGRVALIGQSGAGKSTIASLLRRDRDPSSGQVLLDGRDLRDYHLGSVLRYMGNILQRPEIMSGTVRENILFGVPSEMPVIDAEIWKMIERISPELCKRFGKDGLDTKVGKQGLQLSGGEQQRLCVIRALQKKPQMLVIDEATSSLDSETERVVQEGIDTVLRLGITALVIAHRFSTLRNCNQFVVLKRANHLAVGESQVEAMADSLPELAKISPTFCRLAEAQHFRP